MNTLLGVLQNWVEQDGLRPLDLALARFIAEQQPQADERLLLAAALLSEANGRGHVCLNLANVLANPRHHLKAPHSLEPSATYPPVGEQLARMVDGWSLADWVASLHTSDAVSRQADAETGINNASPFVLASSTEQPLLYLRRYWRYEQHIRQAIEQRLRLPSRHAASAIQPWIEALFADNAGWQKIACALALQSRFAIITGGPGTGKTTTVMALLALLQGLARQSGAGPLNVQLAAPTGKAAARLSASLSHSLQRLALTGALGDILSLIPTAAVTLHRLLGSQPGSRHFRHHAGNQLNADVVVIDEASMVDVELLAKLLDALPAHCHVVLLGDKDQLASVEAGSVLGDLSQTAERGDYTPETAAWLTQATGESIPEALINPAGSPLAQATAQLRHSYRFAQYPGIGELARYVNDGNGNVETLAAIFDRYAGYLQRITLARRTHPDTTDQRADTNAPLLRLLRDGYRGLLEVVMDENPANHAEVSREALDTWALKVFARQHEFQLLCATREGPWGVEALNQLTLRALSSVERLRPMLPQAHEPWYSGRPVLVTRNDYNLGLMNGDIGICLQWPEHDNHGNARLRVAFTRADGTVRWILPSRLQQVETVFAMTVHKSQGSEFAHTALVLPEHHNPVLTKELLYTGITRSSQAFTLVYSNPETLRQTLNTQIERASGLRASGAFLA